MELNYFNMPFAKKLFKNKKIKQKVNNCLNCCVNDYKF